MEARRPWVILAFLCIPVFIGALDLTIVSAILPEVLVSLDLPLETRLDDATWMITGYLLAYTISMTFTGRLSDLFGRRRVYIVCLLIFMFGSYFVAIAHTYPIDVYVRIFRYFSPDERPPSPELRTLNMIILGRVIQALGAGAMAPVTMAMVADLFPPQKRASAIGVIGGIDTVGWVLGHLYGGLMVRFFGTNGDQIIDAFSNIGLNIGTLDWRTLFIINIFFGVITLLAVWIGLRGVPQGRLRERFDLLGTFLIVAALIALTLGLGASSPESATNVENVESAAQNGTIILPLLILAVIAFGLFVFAESRTQFPLIKPSLFKKSNVTSAAFTNICVGFSLTIGLVGIPLLVNFRAENASSENIQKAALNAGLLLSGLTIPMALAAIPGGRLTEKRGYRFATVTGLGMAVIGFLFCTLTWETDTPFILMGFQMAIIGVGLGLTISPIAAAVVNAAGASERGAASAMVLALRLIGMTLALSSLTNFAIDRVNKRVVAESAGVLDTSMLYLEKIVGVVNELFFIGAVVSLLGLLAALWMRGGRTVDFEEEEVASHETHLTEPLPT